MWKVADQWSVGARWADGIWNWIIWDALCSADGLGMGFGGMFLGLVEFGKGTGWEGPAGRT